jgi:inward rectifier potassium channel
VLANKTEEELRQAQAEILILLTGIDEAFEQTVHARASYRADEVLWNARFRLMFLIGDHHRIAADISRVTETEPA